ncbi:MAG: membrane dipeptidase [Chitinophagaceae bacterium]
MKETSSNWSRRRFVSTAAQAGALLAFYPFWSRAARKEDRVTALVKSSMGIDTHNHIDVPLSASELPGPGLDLASEMRKSGFSAICMTFAVDYRKLTQEGQAYARFLAGMDAMDQVLHANKMKRALHFQDLEAAHAAALPIVIQSVEGGHFLEGKIERLGIAYDRGLRHIGLLHDNDASVPLGDIYTKQPQWGGLTEFGAQVIREAERLGMVIDLAHCDPATVDAALKVTTKPVLISHTGLDSQTGTDTRIAEMMRPRLISRERAKIVADAGGVIGVWTHLAESPLAYAENIRAMVDVVGVEHVCIGTDSKLTPPVPVSGCGHGGKQRRKTGRKSPFRTWRNNGAFRRTARKRRLWRRKLRRQRRWLWRRRTSRRRYRRT